MRNPKRYGEEFVAKVAAELDLSESTLYRWKGVAVRIDVNMFEKARSAAAKQGKSLRWTHFEHLATVRDPGERLRILNKVVKEGLNTTRTAELVYEVLNPNPVRGSVSGLRKPRSAAASLKTMENLGEKFLDLCSCYDECVVTEIGAKDKHDADEIERLKANQKLLYEMVTAATGASEAVGELLSNIEKLNAEAGARERDAAGSAKATVVWESRNEAREWSFAAESNG